MNTPKVLFHQFYMDSSHSIGHLKSTTIHLFFYKLYLQNFDYSYIYQKFQSIPNICDVQNPKTSFCEIFYPNQHLIFKANCIAVGFHFILFSFPLFFLTPPFTHSANFYCLQTVRHTRTVHVSGECMTYCSQLYHHSPKIMLQSQALRAQNLPYRLDLMEQILFSTAIQNCKFNQKCTSAHYIEPAHPLERLRSILIPEQPIIKNRFPVNIFQFNQNFAHIGK